ncbi:hypothetical protein [Massilia sp. METH4]|uniref:hypothetical protein n=1 Tax=Massilia sp. METH4 TaxID=3123041 RepID=UPI0030CCF163
MKTAIEPANVKPFSTRKVLRVLLATAALLAIPALSMLAGGAFDWGALDFAAAAALLAGAGLAIELAMAKLRTRFARLAAGGAIVLVLLVAWAELAVGIFH